MEYHYKTQYFITLSFDFGESEIRYSYLRLVSLVAGDPRHVVHKINLCRAAPIGIDIGGIIDNFSFKRNRNVSFE
ncbi:hypothetical protein T01_6983 [Trichinella spiralis]|uniref:Uncharacterized protein n=1 Tax=Trichinella spiralis TaxID=6334 RepID=A0A0V1ALJ6_TRISP|nr:hypothetical protein T01_6983 [Trichinella spiralis]